MVKGRILHTCVLLTACFCLACDRQNLGNIFAGTLHNMAIDKNFRDYLEEQMDLKRLCTIKFRDVQGAVATIKGHIVKMEQVSDREIIETDAGFVIGMDQIISVNDRPQANYC
jgi:hypothetical protein